MTSLLPELDRLQAAAAQANLEIAHMRIEKWKVDGEQKREAQSNADSIQRNLTAALPAMVDNVRSSPQDLAAEFKLYRNLNVLYDVMTSLVESAGAFGPKGDYEALAQQVEVIDSVRRNLADGLERMTASTQAELAQLRNQVRQQQASAPKKIVVDDTQARKAARPKKKPVTPGTSSSGGTSTTPPPNH